ncbi:Serine/threonine-protein kinase PKH2 [Meyerozyma sp. JA9]|nr:Serine/threonine-protein kinase PKH2 [Meyerozyma sp. JA9]
MSEPSHNSSNFLEDLQNDLDEIYNANSHSNGSVDTLDSVTNAVPAYGPRPAGPTRLGHPHAIPPVHISSRLSSLQLSDEPKVVQSEPHTPNSSSSFDFTPRGAQTNSSLNVLLDTPSTEAQFRDIVDPDTPNINSGATAGDDKGDDWAEKGAAVKTVQSGNSVRVIKRTVQDFEFGEHIGEGSYSQVVLARDKHSNKQYAVKVLDKRHIIKEKKVKYVNIEKHALNRLSNQMGIISLYFTFQDKARLYFVLDYASNGELLTLIKKYNTLNEECVRHFGAQILSAIKYMHDNGVIHRDIKPENILLDDQLRIQITDFGTARLLEKKNDESEEYPLDVRAKSFVGTAEYVSPELLENKYCGKPGDIWAFGCIIYQMVAGKPPFKATNEYLTFQKITKLQYAFSAGFPMVLRDLIKQILVLQPSRRATIPTIQKHYFFESVNFDDPDAIWQAPVPELGPYKMSAKSMTAIPVISKSSSQPHISKRQPSYTQKRVASDNPAAPKPGADSTRVNAASVAAFVYGKKDANSDDESGETSEVAERPRSSKPVNGKSRQIRQAPAPDYIPGTNILRPQIKTRQSFSRSSTASRKSSKSVKQPSKSNVMEVTKLSAAEVAWNAYLNHPDERILRIGPVICGKHATEVYERKHRGSLHDSPLGMSSRQRGSSLLSQVVNSGVGLRGGPHSSVAVEDPTDTVDESEAIITYYEIEETSSSKGSDNSGKNSGAPEKTGKSLFKKFLSHGDKSDSTESSSEPVRHHPLEKARTCTLLVTTHGRALIFLRNDADANYKLICEIKLYYPFIRFKELISSGASKLQKLIPSTGTFVIMSTRTSFVCEVEHFEVGQWTEALAKSKINQLERQKSSSDRSSASGSMNGRRTPQESPTLMDAPVFATEKGRQSSSPAPPVPSDRAPPPPSDAAPPPPPPSRRSGEGEHKKESFMAAKLRTKSTKRKPPPVSVSSNGLDMSTGLSSPLANSESGMLHAAQLAVSHSTQSPPTDNRRSSFSKENGSKSYIRVKPPQGQKPVGQSGSKMLARSTRKK